MKCIEAPDGKLYSRRCAHAGGTLEPRADGKWQCPRHGWVFDPATGLYENGVRATPLDEMHDSGIATPRTRQPLKPGELTVQRLGHACALINAGDVRILTDPWLVGTAFAGGWALPKDIQEAVRGIGDWEDFGRNISALYLSHHHTDHWHEETLKRLWPWWPEGALHRLFNGGSKTSVIGPKYMDRVTGATMSQSGSGHGVSMRVIPDATNPYDSGLLVEYKGWRILDQVDCHAFDPVPECDVLLGQFAGGASGYPVCWDMPKEQRDAIIRKHLDATRDEALEMARATGCKLWLPFAGYFQETDSSLWDRNPHNDPDEVSGYLRDHGIRAEAWAAGSMVDLYDLRDRWQELRDYFAWADFRHDSLVLHVDEEGGLRWRVDFRTGEVGEWQHADSERVWVDANREHVWLKAPTQIVQHIITSRCSWDEMTIGFHARMRRSPDVYHRPFWQHFGAAILEK